MIGGAFVLPEVTVGIIDASATRRPSTPCTRSVGRIDDGVGIDAHLAGAELVVVVSAVRVARIPYAPTSADETTLGPG